MFSVKHVYVYVVFFFKQKTAYELRISDWSSDVCSSDLWEVVDDITLTSLTSYVDYDHHQGIEGDGTGSVAKIVKLEHAWRRLDGRNDDGFQVAPFPG